MDRSLVETSRGVVEVVADAGAGPVALVLPGGHCSAGVDVGWDLLRSTGRRVVSLSRPGYGATQVGALTAAEFVPAVAETLRRLGVTQVDTVVGVSFGGPQAVALAGPGALSPRRLVLASAAPSSLPYPDTRRDRVVAPLAFSPGLERLTWASVRALVTTDVGLRAMAASLSRLPVSAWWPTWSRTDRDRARALLRAMRSSSGFLTDLRQGTADRAADRRAALAAVTCPTLVLASPHDGSVAPAHAEDLAARIPGAQLAITQAPTHLFWLGPTASGIGRTIAEFLHGGTSA